MSETESANRQIARAAGTVMLAVLAGQFLGLIRGILVAQAFGAGRELDAFLAANRVSETLFLLVAGGALGSAFIPAFTGLLATGERAAAWRLASAVGMLLMIVLSVLAAASAAFAPEIVRYALAPGFSEEPALFELTVSLLRIQLLSVVLFGVGGLLVGILNAHQVFLVPALTPAMYQVGIIFGALALAPRIGVHGLAWGVVVGAGLYLVIQLPALWRRGGNFTPTLGIGDASVRQVIVLMGPRLLGVAVVQLNFWVNTWLASHMAAGSVTGLYYGFSLMLMAQALIAQSVAIAAMPTFSAQSALGKTDELRGAVIGSLRAVLWLSLPASVGLILLREPLITFLYGRGAFDERSVQLAAWALLWYAAGLVGHSVMEVLTRVFYAQKDTKTPVIVGTCAMLLNVVLSVGLSSVFSSRGMPPHGGLALANSLATAMEATALLLLVRVRLAGLPLRKLAAALGRFVIATSAMSLVVWVWLRASDGYHAALRTAVGTVLGLSAYGAGTLLLRLPEVSVLRDVAGRMFRGRSR